MTHNNSYKFNMEVQINDLPDQWVNIIHINAQGGDDKGCAARIPSIYLRKG